ncbi:MAG: hypothetical protein ACM3O9_02550 [Methylocystaceae bacterium]
MEKQKVKPAGTYRLGSKRENIGLDGNRNPPEDVDTITYPQPQTIYPQETKTK